MIYAILFFLFSLCIGGLSLSFLDTGKKFGSLSRFLFSAVLGFTLQGFLALVGALALKDLEIGAWIAIVISAVAGIIFWRRILEYIKLSTFNFKLSLLPQYIILTLIAGVIVLLAYQSMIWVDGFPSGILKGWGDGAYHMDMIRVLAESNPFQLQHPVAGGTPLTYTFFINFLSALFLKMGASFALAWHLPLFVCGIGIVAGLWNMGKAAIKRSALVLGFIAIVLFGGGLGIFLAPLSSSQPMGAALWDHVADPKYEYTHMDIRTGGKPEAKAIDKNIVWITPAISFFSHQRSFMPAAALAFLFLSGVFSYFQKHGQSVPHQQNNTSAFRWFALLGFLPLMHLHTAVAMGIVAFILLLFNLKGSVLPAPRNVASAAARLLPIGIGIAIALPQLLFLFSNSQAGSSVTPWFGWMTCTHSMDWLACDPATVGTDTNVLWFWLKNFGVVFAAWIVSLFFVKKIMKHIPLFVLYASGLIMFVIGNTFKLQPWEFDNNKLLFYWWVAAIIACMFLAEKLADRFADSPALTIIASCVAGALMVGSLASGAADALARVQLGTHPRPNDSHFGYYGNDVSDMAAYLRSSTAPQSIIISTSYANNFIPMTSGRALYLGFEGWLWTQGRSDTIQVRQRNIGTFLRTGDPSVICADGVTHLYWDAAFQSQYAGFIREGITLGQVKELHSSRSGTLYSLECPDA